MVFFSSFRLRYIFLILFVLNFSILSLGRFRPFGCTFCLYSRVCQCLHFEHHQHRLRVHVKLLEEALILRQYWQFFMKLIFILPSIHPSTTNNNMSLPSDVAKAISRTTSQNKGLAWGMQGKTLCSVAASNYVFRSETMAMLFRFN